MNLSLYLSVHMEHLGYHWKDIHDFLQYVFFLNIFRENSSFIKT